MNILTANRIAHHSSFGVSCILNFLLFLGILHWVGSEPAPPLPEQIFKSFATEEPATPYEPPPEIIDEDPVTSDQMNTFIGCTLPILNDPTPELPGPETPNTAAPVAQPLFVDSVGVVILEGVYTDRGEGGREKAVAKYLPPSVATYSEPSVVKALEWLKAHQHENGSWTQKGDLKGGGANAGYTGLALLTFLAHGETPSSQKYGGTVAKGIRFLVENQDAHGVFQPAGSHTAYGHAIATYAMAEAYLMTDNPLLRSPLERATRVIMKGQMSNGGFDYEYKRESRNDLSLGAWHVQALKAVSMTDVADEKVKQHLQWAMDGMLLGSKKTVSGGRGFTYTVTNEKVDAPRRIISSAGTLGLFLSGRGKSREARESVKFLDQFCESDQLPRWGNRALSPEHGGEIMFWYYTVQAFFQEDPEGHQFKKFVSAMVTELARNQEEDGSWLGYTDKGIHQGPVFNTTLGALSLMTCYRYNVGRGAGSLPASAPVNTKSSDEVMFEI
ncbi:hypothetical protein P0Y35_06600 [Kiritimatiellaeota bacterium B1221]|nr:hypothetical protein [Kiritimatiellaeota bacterium B1221]